METTKETSASELVAHFDNELKTILVSDLKAMKLAKEQLLNNIRLNQDSLTAA